MDTPEKVQIYLTDSLLPFNGIFCQELGVTWCMHKDYTMNEFGRLIQCVFFGHDVSAYMQMSREEQTGFK